MRKRHLKFLTFLEKVAEDVAPVASARIAACLVYKNQIVSIGCNSRKTDPFQAKYARNEESICIHAEIAAIKNALKRIDVEQLAKTTLYICRAKKTEAGSGNFIWGLSKPCCGCRSCIVEFGIRRTVYSLDGTGSFEIM